MKCIDDLIDGMAHNLGMTIEFSNELLEQRRILLNAISTVLVEGTELEDTRAILLDAMHAVHDLEKERMQETALNKRDEREPVEPEGDPDRSTN